MANDEFKAVVDEILARSTARRKATVNRFVELLRRLHAKGMHTYSIVAVGRESEAERIITTQAIRNATGADYRTIIEAFARSVGAGTTHTAPVKQTPLEEAIAMIVDKDVRTRLRHLIAEVKALRNENNTLAAAFKRLSFQNKPAERVAPLPEGSRQAEKIEVLPPAQFDIAPLIEFISEKWIDKKGWVIDGHGTLRDENDDRLTPNGFVPALKTAVQRLQNRPS